MSAYLTCYKVSMGVTDGLSQSVAYATQARHSVACFLTRGDLYISWERGRDTFDRYAHPQQFILSGCSIILQFRCCLQDCLPISRPIFCCGYEGCSSMVTILSTMGIGCG